SGESIHMALTTVTVSTEIRALAEPEFIIAILRDGAPPNADPLNSAHRTHFIYYLTRALLQYDYNHEGITGAQTAGCDAISAVFRTDASAAPCPGFGSPTGTA